MFGRACAFLVGIVIMALGCSGAGIAARGGGGGPGTALGDGFSVARGSELIGTVFPGQGLSSNITAVGSTYTWSAVLRLEGNPIKVMNRYLRQADDAGFEVGADCSLSYDDGRAVPPSGRPPNAESLLSLTCTVIGGTRPDEGAPEDLSIELRRSADRTPYEDNIIIRFARLPADSAPRFAPQGWVATLPAAWETGVPDAPEPPRVAKVGKAIRPGDPDAVRLIDVVDGTRLLAPPALPCFGRGGFDAVLEITRDLDEALDASAMQFQRIDMSTHRSEGRFRGREVTLDEGLGDAGNYLATVVHGTDGQSTYLYLWFCPNQ